MSDESNQPGGGFNILEFGKVISGLLLAIGSIFKSRTPEQIEAKRQADLDEEAEKYRRRFSRGKISKEVLDALLEDIKDQRGEP